MNDNYIDLLGTGRVNAYKAITYYGTVSSTVSDTTWTNDVWVSGDITVPAGKTLFIAAGATIHMAQDDILGSGDFSNRVEFIVEGNIVVQGTASQPVVMDCYKDGDQIWGPIVFGSDSAPLESSFEYVWFKDMAAIAKKADPELSKRVAISFNHCKFDQLGGGSGILISSMMSGDYLEVTDCEFTGDPANDDYAIKTTCYPTATNYEVLISGSTFTGYYLALDLSGGADVSTSGVEISNCDYGIFLSATNPGSPILGPDIDVHDISGIGVLILGGSAVMSGGTIDACDNYGLEVLSSDVEFGSAGLTISNSGLHGMLLDSVSSSMIVENVTISDSANSGLRIIDCSPSVSGVSISGSLYTGIYCDNSSPAIGGVVISGTGGTGIRSTNSSSPSVHSTVLEDVDNAVIIDLVSSGNFGTSSNYGYNEFNNILLKYVLNLNLSANISCLYNCYNGSPVADPKKFGSKYLPTGTVHFTPGFCN